MSQNQYMEEYALRRGRVRNTITNAVANLVDWMPGAHCKVFVGYDKELKGIVKMPIFETWRKIHTEEVSNNVPVG